MNDLILSQDRLCLPYAAGMAGEVWTSFDPGTNAGKVAILRTAGMSERNSEDNLGEPFEAEHLVIRPCSRLDNKTGELIEWRLLVFFAPDGSRYGTTSRPSIKLIPELVALYGPPPWKPPLRLRILEGKGGEFGKFFYLDDMGRAPKEVEVIPDEAPAV